jgi:DNA polymerase I-like protein with 3'-5' exonuclease and polymerase domains
MRFAFIKTPDPVYISTEREAREYADLFAEEPRVGFDTETTGLGKLSARVKFFSLATADIRVCAPVRLLPAFQHAVLEDPRIEKCLTNAKFDMHMVANEGIELKGHLLDTVPMDWLLDENRIGRHGLKQASADYLGLKMAPFSQVFGSVGKTDNEVKILCDMHDAMEARDPGRAVELLALVGQLDGDHELISSLKRVSQKVDAGRGDYTKLLSASQLLSIARKHELCPFTRTQLGYVSDFFELLGAPPLLKEDREAERGLLTDPSILLEAHETALAALTVRATEGVDPLALLDLLVGDYASLDAWASFQLAAELETRLGGIEMGNGRTLLEFYHEETAELLRVLWMMERRGFQLDLAQIHALSDPMLKDIGRLEREFVRLAGWDVNLNSPHQLRDIFFTKVGSEWVDPFGLPPQKLTTGGTTGVKLPSTDKTTIEIWADKGNPLAECLRDHRVLQKLHSTYVSALPEKVDSRDRLHTDLKISGTVTGRLASGDPNLQNIPAKGEWGRKIRKWFVAGTWGACDHWCLPSVAHVSPPDLPRDFPMRLIVADYEQLEMRIMAHLSGDPTMCNTIHAGKDLHSMTAALAVGASYDDIVAAKKADNPTPEQYKLIELRGGMKAVGFGLLYGIGPKKLGMQLGLPLVTNISRSGRAYESCPEAEVLIDKYFGIYPKVLEYIEDTHWRCKEDLFVQTIQGRFRRLPDILSRERGLALQAERQSVNSEVQGSAADIVNKAMQKCENDPEMRALGVRMLLQIHDELVFEAPDDDDMVAQARARVRANMENPFPMSVPILISMDDAYSWGDAK